MEQQKEKKTKSYGRRRQSSSFPLDLLSEILQKLPTKSIARFRCVSKLWSSVTTDPYFINSFETGSLLNPSLLLILRKSNKLFILSFPQNHHNSNNNESSSSYSLYKFQYSESLCFSSVESVHGLIWFRSVGRGSKSDRTPAIWNPTLRQFSTLPKLETHHYWTKHTPLFLGYDPIQGKHKLVCMPCEGFCNECQVLTLGSSSSSVQELSWRRIKTDLYHKPLPGIFSNGRCINGVLYYKADFILGRTKQRVLMSFDLRSEKFKPIVMLPLDTISCLLIVYEGRLAFVDSRYANNGEGIIKLCVLEDPDKKKWSRKSFRVPFSSYDLTSLQLSGVTNGGEFIYIPTTIPKSFWVLYFDPKRKNFRKVIADEEFRLSNGLGDDPFEVLQAFPNHIQSLIPLKDKPNGPNPCAFDPTQFDNVLKKLKPVTNPRARFYEDKRESEEEEDDDEKDTVIETSLPTKRKREEIIQEPKRIKLKKLCKQILKKDGGFMKLKKLKSLMDEQAPSALSEFSSRKDAISYLKLKMEQSRKFVVDGKKISLLSRKK